MNIIVWLESYTNLSRDALFGATGNGTDALVQLNQDGKGVLSISTWKVSGVTKPTVDQLAAAVKAPDPTPSLTQLLTYAAGVRYAKQTSQLTINGIAIATDDYSRGLINGAVDGLNQNPNVAAVDFKSANGWVSIPRATMISIGSALFSYIQACFTSEKAIDTAINNKSITTTAGVDNANWPSTTINV